MSQPLDPEDIEFVQFSGHDLGVGEGRVVGAVIVVQDPDGTFRAVSGPNFRGFGPPMPEVPSAEVRADLESATQTAWAIANLAETSTARPVRHLSDSHRRLTRKQLVERARAFLAESRPGDEIDTHVFVAREWIVVPFLHHPMIDPETGERTYLTRYGEGPLLVDRATGLVRHTGSVETLGMYRAARRVRVQDL